MFSFTGQGQQLAVQDVLQADCICTPGNPEGRARQSIKSTHNGVTRCRRDIEMVQ